MSDLKNVLPQDISKIIGKEAEAHSTRLKELVESEKDEAYAQGFAEGWGEGATAYATKLIECDKGNSALEEKVRGLEAKIEQADTKLNDAIDLLREVHETGYDLLLKERIRIFLYGE